MVFRKHNSTAGFSLIEVLVAITILGLVIAPIGSSLVLSFRLNARSDEVLQAQLAVSSAVETIMAEGFDETKVGESNAADDAYCERFPDVVVTVLDDSEAAYKFNVKSEFDESISVDTYARPKVGGT